MRRRIVRIVLPAVISVVGEQSFYNSQPCFAITYLTIEQAQQALSPQTAWEKLNISLTEDQIDQIEDLCGSSFIDTNINVWRSPTNDFFIVDNVLGKHEYISYAVLINSAGSVKGVEILDYREAFGDEIRRAGWRKQFVSKNINDKIELNEDILNISGATISCSHVTKGIKRLLTTYEHVLKNWISK